MNKTQIEWVKNPDGSQGYTWNPITGCLNHDNGLCKGGGFPCYAYKLAHTRLKQRYLANRDLAGLDWVDGVPIVYGQEKHDSLMEATTDPFYPRFWEERLTALHVPRKADSPKKGIFVCDMGDLFGDCIPRSWQEQVFNAIKANPDYRFYLLTKQPQNLLRWSPFPENCWVGVTATNQEMLIDALSNLAQVKATIKYISFEPLLEGMNGGECEGKRLEGLKEAGVNWLIIGACTGSYAEMLNLYHRLGGHSSETTVLPIGKGKYSLHPRIEWVREIVEAADKAGIPVFLKDNLNPMFAENDCVGFNQYKDHLFTIVDNFPTRYHLRQEMPKGVK